MIPVQKMNGDTVYVNPHLIEVMTESAKEVHIQFISGKVILIKNSVEEVNHLIIEYRKKLGSMGQEI